MSRTIRKAAVLGSGVMGAAIAAHLANVGIPCYLLDIVLKDEKNRNKLSEQGKTNALKAKPAAFMSQKDGGLVTVGNFEDNMNWLAEVDWVVEVVIERLDIKKKVFADVAKYWKEGMIISSNTSGISIKDMSADLPEAMQKSFLGTHFFNPARYMKLLEIIPGPKTSKEVIEFMAEFGEKVLGKGIVYAKDTPNFIANRIGVYGMAATMKTVADGEYRIEEIDKIVGTPMGRAKSAIFGTADIVGLDTLFHVIKNVYDNVKEDPQRDIFMPPEFLSKMIEKNLLGRKSKSGFFKMEKTPEGKKNILVINPKTLAYEAQVELDVPSLKAVKGEANLAKRMQKLCTADDRAGQYAWKSIRNVALYALGLIPEISDDIVNIDNGMKWGFNWEMGPFESMDAIGLKTCVEMMEKEGTAVPEKIKQVLKKGDSFYKKDGQNISYFDFASDGYKAIAPNPAIIDLNYIKGNKENVLAKNTCASVIDIGDGVACLQFHSEMQPDMNPIDDQIILMMQKSVEIVKEKKMAGLIMANHSKNFCVGANLMLIGMNAAQKKFDLIERASKELQDATMMMKLAPFPVVAVPHQMVLGGGCEICLGADHVHGAAETYLGLVEVGVGVIPAGGGCKELAIRTTEGCVDDDEVSLIRFIGRAFQNIATAKVATSFKEAIDFGYLRKTDTFSPNHDHRIADAKNVVLGMVKAGYKAPLERKDIRVAGREGIAAFSNIAWTMMQGKYASEHDYYISRKVAYIICGGDVAPNTRVSEQYLLDLEREVFVHLCGHEKSLARIQHMVMKKKPLRN